jgi:uncharacterized RDD family membrane protein YckC
MSIEPGWYKDPAEPATQRYWDGEGWVGDPLPADAQAPPGPPPARAAPAAPVPAPAPAPVVPGPVATQPVTAPTYPRYQIPPTPHGHPVARPERRLAARVIDGLAVLGLNVIVNGWFVYQWWQDVEPYISEYLRRQQAGQSISNIPTPQRAGGLQFAILFIGVALWFAYEVPALASSGQTLGKRLLGLKVVRVEADAPLGYGRAIRRWNPIGLPTLLWPCGIGFVLQFLDCLFVAIDRSPLHQALHDRSAATVVVQLGRKNDEGGPP